MLILLFHKNSLDKQKHYCQICSLKTFFASSHCGPHQRIQKIKNVHTIGWLRNKSFVYFFVEEAQPSSWYKFVTTGGGSLFLRCFCGAIRRIYCAVLARGFNIFFPEKILDAAAEKFWRTTPNFCSSSVDTTTKLARTKISPKTIVLQVNYNWYVTGFKNVSIHMIQSKKLPIPFLVIIIWSNLMSRIISHPCVPKILNNCWYFSGVNSFKEGKEICHWSVYASTSLNLRLRLRIQLSATPFAYTQP